jgi:hypothetical protein
MKENNEKTWKSGWMVKYYIWLQGEMELEFIKNVNKQGEFQFIWNPNCACFDTVLKYIFRSKASFFLDLKLEWNDRNFENKISR